MLDIVECTMEVLDLQQKRSDSVRNRKWDGFHSFMEVTKRRLKKTGSLGYTSIIPARPRAPAAPASSPLPAYASSPLPPRMRDRRRSLVENTSTSSSSSDSDLGSKILQTDSGALLGQKEGGLRRRASLDHDLLTPNANWALTA
jgi:hypothetical protein